MSPLPGCCTCARRASASAAEDGDFARLSSERKLSWPGSKTSVNPFKLFGKSWQEWQGSNLRPPVLETGALPIELHSCREPASPPVRAVSSISRAPNARAKQWNGGATARLCPAGRVEALPHTRDLRQSPARSRKCSGSVDSRRPCRVRGSPRNDRPGHGNQDRPCSRNPDRVAVRDMLRDLPSGPPPSRRRSITQLKCTRRPTAFSSPPELHPSRSAVRLGKASRSRELLLRLRYVTARHDRFRRSARSPCRPGFACRSCRSPPARSSRRFPARCIGMRSDRDKR